MDDLSPHLADWLPLAPNGDPAKWWFDPPHLRIAEGAWVFTDNELRGEVGGMSWDNYILSAQVLIHRWAEDAHFQVELTAVGTNVYCQLLPPCIVLAYFSQEKHGTDFFGKSPPLTPEHGVWRELAMQAQNGVITVFFDGRPVLSGKSPHGTQGMPGIVIKKLRHVEIRLKDLRVRFLDPTPAQLAEYQLDALTNWRNHEAAQGAAPQRS
ncbi:MAG TPA: hypothetical protein VHS06_09865 [Chloroflexota bacterium]|nr:hypothetical protein [Chloroflexota bacterium]